MTMTEVYEGVVMRGGRPPLPVLAQDRLYHCLLRGRLRREAADEPNFLVAGDRVQLAPLGGEQGVIMARLPRVSQFGRRMVNPHGGGGRVEQVIVANLDVLVVVQAATRPDFNPGRLDRYLLSARRGGVTPVVVINKINSLSPSDFEERRAAVAKLATQVEVHWTSVPQGAGLTALATRLAGRISAFVGSSGVGKSSLINALDPTLGQRTQAGRDWLGKGRHTTTAAEVLPFGADGFLVDTPGLRAFATYALAQEELEAAFPDIAALAQTCRFADCQHLAERDCAVQQAVASGQIEPERLHRYRKLQRELER